MLRDGAVRFYVHVIRVAIDDSSLFVVVVCFLCNVFLLSLCSLHPGAAFLTCYSRSSPLSRH